MPVQIDDNSGQMASDLGMATGAAIGAAFFIPGVQSLFGSVLSGAFKGAKSVGKGIAKGAYYSGKGVGTALGHESGLAGTGLGGSGMGIHHLLMKPAYLGLGIAGKATNAMGMTTGTKMLKSLQEFTAHPIRNTAYRAGYAVAAGTRIAVGGAAYGAVGIAKTVVNTHGLALAGLAGAAGVGMAMTRTPDASTQIVGGGMVDAMGGTSQYGIRSMMNTMNASGDVVLGANNRRRG